MKPKNLLFLCLSFYILNSTFSIATVRYVSKTGTSQPPYTSWETAADSIQKCINICVYGDTIIVANGVYHESLVVNKYLWLIGSSMDSTTVDGTGLANTSIDFQSDAHISFFTIIGKGEGIVNTRCIGANLTNVGVKYCRILNATTGVGLVWSSSVVDQCIITSVRDGFSTYCAIDTCNPIIKNSFILVDVFDSYAILTGDGENNIFNNLIIGINDPLKGIGNFFATKINIVGNTISGFDQNIDVFRTLDSAKVYNNVSSYSNQTGFTITPKIDMRNNIAIHNEVGVVGPSTTNSDYNLYWQNNTHTTEGLAEHDIIANPMFINDTIPTFEGSYDYHLQAYSPAIDSGDPNILDVDGTRSDIGAYGGPLGQSYKYQDLAPRPPVNLSGQYDSLNIEIKWNRNTESDLDSYKIYRDTIPDFPADSTTFILSLTDTTYSHLIPPGKNKFYYKITAVDNQGNESLTSEELLILIVSVEEYPVIVNDYRLYQNYPNPFNPTTKIGYNIKERAYVKLMVYDIKGELVSVLANKEQNAGYYEVDFNVGNGLPSVPNVPGLASGIYLYRIEIIGEGRIPVFSDMKKMILIK